MHYTYRNGHVVRGSYYDLVKNGIKGNLIYPKILYLCFNTVPEFNFIGGSYCDLMSFDLK